MTTCRLVWIGWAAVVVAGCGSGPTVDRQSAALLEGEWTLALTIDSAPGVAGPLEIRGTVALLTNRAGTNAPDFPGTPLNIGVHDLALGTLSPGLGGRDIPEVVGGAAGDSAFLMIGPGADRPVRLRGRRTTDSIIGRWTAYQRAGPGYDGGFVMTRR